MKIKDFDEAMSIVQVWIQKFGVQNVLLDGRFGVNIISENLRKKVGLQKLQPTSFVVRMADQKRFDHWASLKTWKSIW